MKQYPLSRQVYLSFFDKFLLNIDSLNITNGYKAKYKSISWKFFAAFKYLNRGDDNRFE